MLPLTQMSNKSFLAVSNISIYATFYLFNYFVLKYVANGILNIIGLVAEPSSRTISRPNLRRRLSR
jgi:hypothetical protein